MPYTDQGLPFQGQTPQSKHASWTGARAAARTRGRKTQAYLDLLATSGPLCDQAVAEYMGWALSSVNSIRNGVKQQIVADGFEREGGCRRTRWRLRSVRDSRGLV